MNTEYILKMYFETTKLLLSDINCYFDISDIKITSENDIRKCRSDMVKLIENQNIGFEVFENEIIIFYFTEHEHFEDYTSDLKNGFPDYVTRAREFLKNLFTLPLKRIDFCKGKKLFSRKYYLILPDGTNEYIGGTSFAFCSILNIFSAKSSFSEIRRFDSEKKLFISDHPWSGDDDAFRIIEKSKDCIIEIFEKDKVYSYKIFCNEFDRYYGNRFWIQRDRGSASFFDTAEKAIAEAEKRAEEFSKDTF